MPIKDEKYVPIEVQKDESKENFFKTDATLMIKKSLFGRFVKNRLALDQLLSNNRRRQYNLEGA